MSPINLFYRVEKIYNLSLPVSPASHLFANQIGNNRLENNCLNMVVASRKPVMQNASTLIETRNESKTKTSDSRHFEEIEIIVCKSECDGHEHSSSNVIEFRMSGIR